MSAEFELERLKAEQVAAEAKVRHETVTTEARQSSLAPMLTPVSCRVLPPLCLVGTSGITHAPCQVSRSRSLSCRP